MDLKELRMKQEIIGESLLLASDNIPESLIPVKRMLFINGKINDKEVKLFVDTGAQMSLISETYSKELDLEYLIDYHHNQKVYGVGSGNIIGRIHYLEIDLGDGVKLPSGFSIIDSDEMKLILGLDTLLSHGCLIDLFKKTLSFGGFIIKFDGY